MKEIINLKIGKDLKQRAEDKAKEYNISLDSFIRNVITYSVNNKVNKH